MQFFFINDYRINIGGWRGNMRPKEKKISFVGITVQIVSL